MGFTPATAKIANTKQKKDITDKKKKKSEAGKLGQQKLHENRSIIHENEGKESEAQHYDEPKHTPIMTRSTRSALYRPKMTVSDVKGVAVVNMETFKDCWDYGHRNIIQCDSCLVRASLIGQYTRGGCCHVIIGCPQCKKAHKVFKLAKKQVIPKSPNSNRKNNSFRYDVPMREAMATSYNGLGNASVNKRSGFGVSNPTSNKCLKRYSKMNDKQNNVMMKDNLIKQCDNIKNGKSKVKIMTTTDGGYSQRRNAKHCSAPVYAQNGKIIACATASKGANGVSKKIDSGALEPIAINECDEFLTSQKVMQNIMCSDGDSRAATRKNNYEKENNMEVTDARSARHAMNNFSKLIDSNKRDKGRKLYDTCKEVLKNDYSHDKHKGMVSHIRIVTSMVFTKLYQENKHENDLKEALIPKKDLIMARLKKVPNHCLSKDEKHSDCAAVGLNADWCGVRREGANYKSAKNTIRGKSQPIVVCKEGNKVLNELWDGYWTWPLVLAVLLGYAINGTQKPESFMHVRDGFTNKRISTKDSYHYAGQTACAVLQCNEGYKTINDKLNDAKLETRAENKQIVSQLDKEKVYNAKYSKEPKHIKKRKLQSIRDKYNNKNTKKNYCKGKWTVPTKSSKKSSKKSKKNKKSSMKPLHKLINHNTKRNRSKKR